MLPQFWSFPVNRWCRRHGKWYAACDSLFTFCSNHGGYISLSFRYTDNAVFAFIAL